MSNLWHDTLTQLGADLSQPYTIITKASERETRVIPLVHQKVISVLGEQAHDFLQGQLSCDLRTIDNQGSGLGAHCNIKGAMLALYRLFRVENGYWLRVESDIAQAAQTNLNKYIIFSKAETKDCEQDIVGLGLIGPGATALIERLLERAPSEVNSTISSGQICATRLAGDRFELWLTVAEAIKILPALLEQTALGSTNDWLLSEVRSATPNISAAVSETFIPQMTNLQAVDGVSFTKGCYTGQEIVTRLQHRGKLNKPMYLAQVTTDTAPNPGDYIDSPNKSRCGQVVLSAQNEHGQFELLAVITKATADSDTLYMEGKPDQTIELLPLPYTLDPELFERKG